MQTIRGRLTAWYSAALALTLAAFAAVLYLDRRNASYQDLDQRMRSEAALTAGVLPGRDPARPGPVGPPTPPPPALLPPVAPPLPAAPPAGGPRPPRGAGRPGPAGAAPAAWGSGW